MVLFDIGNCYRKRIKIIYCKTCNFQSYKMFIQAYFQNDCSCTVLHISDSPAKWASHKCCWKSQSAKRCETAEPKVPDIKPGSIPQCFEQLCTKDVSFSLWVDVYQVGKSHKGINNFVSTNNIEIKTRPCKNSSVIVHLQLIQQPRYCWWIFVTSPPCPLQAIVAFFQIRIIICMFIHLFKT